MEQYIKVIITIFGHPPPTATPLDCVPPPKEGIYVEPPKAFDETRA